MATLAETKTSTKPLKVLMIAPTPYFADRGCHVRIYEEARALQGRGHQVRIVTYHLGRDVGDIPVVRIPRIPWYRKLSAGPSWHKPYLDILLLWTYLREARRFQPDIVHAHLHEGAFLAGLTRWFVKAPILFDCQGSLVGELLDHGFMRKGGLLHRMFGWLERWITRGAGRIVTSSSQTAKAISAEFPDLSERIVPLIDAVDTDCFRPLGKDRTLLADLGVPHDKTLLIYLGAMTDYQGVGLLLDALTRLKTKRDDFHALLMGYPEADYIKRAEQLELLDVTTFTGKIDYAEAVRYLSLGDVAVSPKTSATEANGKLLNYMACGLPSVVFDNPVNRELLGEHGCYAEPTSASGFARVVAEMLDDVSGLGDRAQSIRKYAVEVHSWSARIVQLEQCYHDLLKH